MANKTINDLTALTGVASADLFPLWDASGSVTRKATLTNIFAVLLGQTNSFTATQTIAVPGTTTVSLILDTPASSTAQALQIKIGGTAAILAIPAGPGPVISLQPMDTGNNIAGSYLVLGNNTNATKPGAGFVRFYGRAGSINRVWADSTGVMRIHNADPIYDNDAAGTVIGTQTSMAEAKNLLGEVGDPVEALRAIVAAAKTGLRRFTYKSGSFNNEEFEGVVTDLAPRYGMDRDEEHPAGKSLNEIQLFGDLIRAVALLAAKVGIE